MVPKTPTEKGVAVASALRERPATLFASMQELGAKGVVAGPWTPHLLGYARFYPDGKTAAECCFSGEHNGWMCWVRLPDGTTWGNDPSTLLDSCTASAAQAEDKLDTSGVILVEPGAQPWKGSQA